MEALTNNSTRNSTAEGWLFCSELMTINWNPWPTTSTDGTCWKCIDIRQSIWTGEKIRGCQMNGRIIWRSLVCYIGHWPTGKLILRGWSTTALKTLVCSLEWTSLCFICIDGLHINALIKNSLSMDACMYAYVYDCMCVCICKGMYTR